MLKRDRMLLLIIACVLLFAQSCASGDTSSNTSIPAGDASSSEDQFALNADLESQISSAEEIWLSFGIEDYAIEVTIVSIWHLQTNRIQVHNGEVLTADAICQPSPTEGDSCEVQPFKAEDFTVSGLFRYARTEARRDGGEWTEIEFEPNYGFPNKIHYDNPGMFDEEFTLLVIVFEPIE